MGIKVQIIHNASIMNACAACGLQLYAFGQTISIPFYNEDWRPNSFYHKMKFNLSGGLHTLCLLGALLRFPANLLHFLSSPSCRHQGAGARLQGAIEGTQGIPAPPIHDNQHCH
jgi:hypothetical protein